MLSLLIKILQSSAIVALAVAAPLIAWRRADQGWKRAAALAIHIVAMLMLLGGLVAAQFHWQLEVYVRSSLSLVRILWLPLVGTLLYATAWAGWFVAWALRKPTEQPLFDTATASLHAGLQRIERAGIDVLQTPLYLVLGSPSGGIRSFFAAAHTDLIVLPQSEEADEPIQVCGNREAIYVCCRDVSLLSKFTRQAAEFRVRRRDAVAKGSSAIYREPAHHWDRSERPTAPIHMAPAKAGLASTATLPAAPTVTGGRETAPGDRETLERMSQTIEDLEVLTVEEPQATTDEVLQPQHASSPLLHLSADDAESVLERLEAVCRELSEYREPYCPINGVLLMVPLDAADNVETADHVGMRVERDLATITAATESSVSAQWIFCDLDRCSGSHAFLERFPEAQRNRRLGTTLPAPPPSEPDAEAKGIDQAVSWICNELFPPLGYRLMKRELQEPASDGIVCQANRHIHQLVDSMRQRREGMSRMLRRAVVAASGRIRLRGCFIAATGEAGDARQAFAEGLLPLILDLQNEVQWTSDRRRRDRWQRAAAIAIYASVVTAAAGTIFWGIHTLG